MQKENQRIPRNKALKEDNAYKKRSCGSLDVQGDRPLGITVTDSYIIIITTTNQIQYFNIAVILSKQNLSRLILAFRDKINSKLRLVTVDYEVGRSSR